MTALWCLAAAALVLAGAALLRAHQTARELDRLSAALWDLRYEHGQLVSRLDELVAANHMPPDPTAQRAPSRETTAFVPLSSLKR